MKNAHSGCEMPFIVFSELLSRCGQEVFILRASRVFPSNTNLADVPLSKTTDLKMLTIGEVSN